LWEQNNKLWEQDIILREQNNFFPRMALVSHRRLVFDFDKINKVVVFLRGDMALKFGFNY